MQHPLWTPSPERIAGANMTRFIDDVKQRWQLEIPDYAALYRFSVARPADFWSALWDFTAVIGDKGSRIVEDLDKMPGARFFPDARLNFAENMLRGRGDRPAMLFADELGLRRTVTTSALAAEVEAFAGALMRAGVGAGDRVAGYLPNLPETMVAALGTAAIGAVWSSCSPDFGAAGVLDRFGQIAPVVLVAADGYRYAGKVYDSLGRLAEVAAALPTVRQVVVVPYLDSTPALPPAAVLWRDFLDRGAATHVPFQRFPFNHPLYILFSSGTTGVPKCIVHGAGGTLLTHLKEHALHCDIKPGDRVFYYTTCGWMMWNWLLSARACDATLVLYDGSPVHPSPNALFDLIDASGITLFGTSAKFLDAVHKAGLTPATTHRLDALRTITSTGSPLAAESFDFVYRDVKRDLHLASIAGGTDIVGCFVGGDPTSPVWRGEIQARLLGMRVQVFDDEGRAVEEEKGELVCTMPFPSMPLGFWNDPNGSKYHAAYFERYPGVWHHGDYVELTAHDGMIIYGRSDAVLNPGGVRIGTAEIYRQVEQISEVLESLVIGQQWSNDERVVLFVRLKEGVALSADLEERIRRQLRQNATPRHVPARIVQVTDLPRTRSGKIVEIAVREVVHGRSVKNHHAIANPQALEQYREREELRT